MVLANRYCRTCLKDFNDSTASLRKCFISPEVANKLVCCTMINVELNDEFPKHLCDCCFDLLEKFDAFRIMCFESIARFREMLSATTNYKVVKSEEDITIVEVPIAEANPDIVKEELPYLENSTSLLEIEMHELSPQKVDPIENPLEIRSEKKRNRQKTPVKDKIKKDDGMGEPQSTKKEKKKTCGDRLNVPTSEKKIHSSGGRTQRSKPITETENLASLPHTGINELSVQINDSTTNVMEIQRKKRKRPPVEVNSRKGYRISAKSVQSEAKKACQVRLKEPNIETETVHQQQQTNDEKNSSKSSKMFQCDKCSKRFFVEHKFTAHLRKHDGLSSYPCPHADCGRGFERLHSLKFHLKQHEGTVDFIRCEEPGCNHRYTHKHGLTLHLRKYHKMGPELNKYVCEVCGNVYKSSSILSVHRYTHKDKSELPYACNEPGCERRFAKRETLQVHMMRHAGIKKFVCSFCGMRKTTKKELKVHMNYHTLERRFPCRFCSQIFNNSGNLNRHVRAVHEGVKDFPCRHCDRTFAKAETRKHHEMIHTGEKPHECSVCGKRFIQSVALRTHQKTHLRQQTDSGGPYQKKTHIEEALHESSGGSKCGFIN